MSTTALATTQPRTVLDISGGQVIAALGLTGVDVTDLVTVMRAQVFKPRKGDPQPTDAEVAAALMVASAYKLNPFRREIFLICTQQGYMPYVSVDGWANLSAGKYDELRFVETTDEHGNLVACTCHLKAAERSWEITEYLRECRRDTAPWKQSPHRQLRHKTFMQTVRLAFGVSGVAMDDDEPARIGFDPDKAVGGGDAAPASKGAALIQRLQASQNSASEPRPEFDRGFDRSVDQGLTGGLTGDSTGAQTFEEVEVVRAETENTVTHNTAKLAPYRDEERVPEGCVVAVTLGTVASVREAVGRNGRTYFEVVVRDPEHDTVLLTFSTTARALADALHAAGEDAEFRYYAHSEGTRRWNRIVAIIPVVR